MMTALTVEDCLETCNKFCKVIKKSFGPRGELSFIISCTGQGQFTTNGMTIMGKIQSLHPVARIILQTLQKHHDCIGDGSKTFVILLHEIFVQIFDYKSNCLFTNNARIKLIHGLNFLLHNVLPDCFMELRSNISEVTKESIVKHGEDIFSTVLCMLRTFFSGKFGLSVSDYLSDLVHFLLIKHSETWKSASLSIKYTVDNFDVLCSAGGIGSLSESQILPGVMLSRTFSVYCNSKASKDLMKFIIVDNASTDTLDASFSIKSNQQLYTSLENEFNVLKTSIERKQQEEISLIISSGRVSDHIKGLCRDYDIQLITMVPVEEINYLIQLSEIQPVQSFTDKVSAENCGHLSFVKTLQIRNKDYAHLGLKCKQSNSFSYHLILNGPSDRICKQYLKELWNSLKLINVWRKDFDRYFQESYRNGIESNCKENLPITCIGKKISQNSFQQTASPYNIDSSDLHEHSDIEYSCFSLKSLCISKCSPHFTICPAGGCWELCLHHILTRKKLNNPDLIIACRILSKSLITIPRILYTNNYCKTNRFPDIWKLITENLQLNKICYLDKWGEVQTAEVANRFEPVIVKEMIISEVIQLVIQLLRLQSIVV